MADYTVILDTQLDPDAPITSSLGYQFRDNPEAIAEGSPNAPKISPTALGGIFVGALDQNGTTYAGFTGLDRIKTLHLTGSFSGSGDASLREFQTRYSEDNGVNWTSPENFLNPPQSSVGFMTMTIDLQTGTVNVITMTSSDQRIVNSVTHTVPSNTNSFQIRNQRAGGSMDAIVMAVGGRSP